jgi:hypothetical protein
LLARRGDCAGVRGPAPGSVFFFFSLFHGVFPIRPQPHPSRISWAAFSFVALVSPPLSVFLGSPLPCRVRPAILPPARPPAPFPSHYLVYLFPLCRPLLSPVCTRPHQTTSPFLPFYLCRDSPWGTGCPLACWVPPPRGRSYRFPPEAHHLPWPLCTPRFSTLPSPLWVLRLRPQPSCGVCTAPQSPQRTAFWPPAPPFPSTLPPSPQRLTLLGFLVPPAVVAERVLPAGLRFSPSKKKKKKKNHVFVPCCTLR